MGMYINPTNGKSKLEWAKMNGAELVVNPVWPAPAGRVYLSWVDNGFFDALGVCFSQRELEDFKWIDEDPTDGRPHRFYIIDKSAVLKPEAGVEKSYLKELDKLP